MHADSVIRSWSDLDVVRVSMGSQVALGLERLAAVRTQMFLLRPVNHLVLPQIAQPHKHLPKTAQTPVIDNANTCHRQHKHLSLTAQTPATDSTNTCH
jgi:hypothetical protein